jgi:hypothetical protein
MALAIAHVEDERSVLDVLREWRPPFSPEAVVTECVELLYAYGCTTVTGDWYEGAWPPERFATRGVHYEVADRAKSELCRDLLPLVNAGRVELLDHPRLKRAQGGSDFHLSGLVALCRSSHDQNDAPYTRGKLVVTPFDLGQFSFKMVQRPATTPQGSVVHAGNQAPYAPPGQTGAQGEAAEVAHMGTWAKKRWPRRRRASVPGHAPDGPNRGRGGGAPTTPRPADGS